jgi:hypothetical protein
MGHHDHPCPPAPERQARATANETTQTKADQTPLVTTELG